MRSSVVTETSSKIPTDLNGAGFTTEVNSVSPRTASNIFAFFCDDGNIFREKQI